MSSEGSPTAAQAGVSSASARRSSAEITFRNRSGWLSMLSSLEWPHERIATCSGVKTRTCMRKRDSLGVDHHSASLAAESCDDTGD